MGFNKHRPAFSLIELMVVIGVIVLLLAMLMPALHKAQTQAKWVQCRSNLHQIGVHLQMYANQWGGWFYPPDLGTNVPMQDRWPVQVFKPAVYNPAVMLCPADIEPAAQHSYLINGHIAEQQIKFGSMDLGGLSSSDVVLMGEKTSDVLDYYMNAKTVGGKIGGDYLGGKIEWFRHGVQLGSNYLYFDLHVDDFRRPELIRRALDPWEIKADIPSTAH